jgi:hypothetical protein
MSSPYDQPEFKAIASYLNDGGLVGMGTSPSGKSYGYLDNDPTLRGGKYYVYRLVDVSTDGVRTDHQSIAVLLDDDVVTAPPTSGFSVENLKPNPANDYVTVGFNLVEPKAVTIEIYSTDGKRVSTPIEARSYGVGRQVESISVKDLVPGVYTAVFSTDSYGQVRTRQFVVVR